MRRLVDYAGLFPPAASTMNESVASYAEHRAARDGWMLGRFVVPVERLDELVSAAGSLVAEPLEAWRLSALIGADSDAAGATIREFNAAHRERFVVDVVECRPTPLGSIARSVGALPGELRSFVELPLRDEPREMLAEIGAAGAWAKLRTGGVTAEAFPTSRELARAIVRAAELHVPFKATAGLHHPLTGEYPLTYDADSPSARMFGFLNVFAAAVFAHNGADEPTLVQLLEDREPDAIVFDDELRWRDMSASAEQIASARASLSLSFGSCSFAEPVEGLRSMRLL